MAALCQCLTLPLEEKVADVTVPVDPDVDACVSVEKDAVAQNNYNIFPGLTTLSFLGFERGKFLPLSIQKFV